MIQLSKELQEYLEIKQDKANEGGTDICTDFLVLLYKHCTDFFHECSEDFLVSSYTDFIDNRTIVFTTVKGGCETNAFTTISLENRSENWKY